MVVKLRPGPPARSRTEMYVAVRSPITDGLVRPCLVLREWIRRPFGPVSYCAYSGSRKPVAVYSACIYVYRT